jgi:integrase
MAKIYKRGEIWWGRVSYRGKEYRRSLDTPLKGVAGERLLSFVADVKAGKWGDKPRRKFDEAVNRFIDEHFPRIKPTSAKRYRVSLMNLAEHLIGKYLDEIGSAALSDFEVARRAAGVTNSTIRRDLVCLALVYSLAEDWEWIEINPAKAYLRKARKRGLVESEPRDEFLPNADEEQLFDHLQKLRREATHPRDRHGYQMQEAAFAFAIDAGFRDGEIFSLRWPEIDLKRREARVVKSTAKNSRARSVPILKRSLKLLAALPRSRHTDLVFWHRDGRRYSQMYVPLQRRCEEAQITPVSFHALRRTCGMRRLRDDGMSIEEVSAWLGHSGVEVTQKVYAFLGVDQLHQAVERSHKSRHVLKIEDRRTSNKSLATQRISSNAKG